MNTSVTSPLTNISLFVISLCNTFEFNKQDIENIQYKVFKFFMELIS